jgi:NADP-dependent 3-hydroxy acid dehydrogenase YdfG
VSPLSSKPIGRAIRDGNFERVAGYAEEGTSIMNDSKGRKPRVVVITGASAGIGRAIAKRFARAGDRIGLIARDSSALEDVARELRAYGAETAAVPIDVADADAVFAAAEHLERQLGKIDIWINDAMETVFSPVADMTPDEYHRVTEVC